MLLMFDGLPHTPSAAGNGGRKRGIDRLPSIASMSAVSSPATYDSPTSETSISNAKSVPKMCSPSRPLA